MTESEWLKTGDPFAMLNTPLIHEGGPVPRAGETFSPSEHKLKMYVVACCEMASVGLGEEAKTLANFRRGNREKFMNWARGWAGDQKSPPPAVRADLLRDIMGNPFRPVELPQIAETEKCGPWDVDGHVIVKSYTGRSFCPWLTPDVLRLANLAHEERVNDGSCELDRLTLTVLADALQDAGCQSDPILDHLCAPRLRHWRGCWVIDALLGRE